MASSTCPDEDPSTRPRTAPYASDVASSETSRAVSDEAASSPTRRDTDSSAEAGQSRRRCRTLGSFGHRSSAESEPAFGTGSPLRVDTSAGSAGVEPRCVSSSGGGSAQREPSGVVGQSEAPADKPPAAGSARDNASDDEWEEGSSVSGASEMRVMEKHVQSLLNPNARRDFVFRVLAVALALIVGALVVKELSELVAVSNALRNEGARVTTTFTCPADLPPNSAISYDPSTGYTLGYGARAATIATTSLAGAGASDPPAVAHVAKLASLPRHQRQALPTALFLSRAALNRTAVILLTYADDSRQVERRYDFALQHAAILSVSGQPVSAPEGAWHFAVCFETTGGAVSCAGVDVPAANGGPVAVAGAVAVFPEQQQQQQQGRTVLLASASPGSFRYLAVASSPADASRYFVFERQPLGTLSITARSVSSHYFGRALDILVLPEPAGDTADGSSFVLLGQHGALVGSFGAAAVAERRARSLRCGDAGRLPEGFDLPAASGRVAVACRGGAVFTATLLSNGRYLTDLAVDAVVARPQPAFEPLSVVPGEHSFLVVGTVAGATGASSVAAVRIAPGTEGPARLVASELSTAARGAATAYLPGSGGRVLALDAAQRTAATLAVSWVGGLRLVGVTAAPCRGGAAAPLLQLGLLPVEQRAPAITAGFPVYATAAGRLTSDPAGAAFEVPVGLAVSPDKIYVDVLSRH
ncbi:hypothetical protein DIPPA_04635 [Diplonema papillatum]|nr:hypothetical protein DIPPA_04635 [Diplonema papillatum]